MPDAGPSGELRRRERAAAILAPAATLLIGALVPKARAARLVTDASIVASVASAIAVAWASRRPTAGQVLDDAPIRAGSARVHVLVPARDEAAVIGDLVADLGAQDLRHHVDGSPGFHLTVIDDRSVDGTGEIARAAIDRAGLATVATCLRRDDEPDGKGAALAAARLDDIDDATIVLVLDADARIAPGVLSAVVQASNGAAPGITARRRMLVPEDGHRAWLARCQDDEQTVDGAIQDARLALGGTGEFRGNGMALRARDLRSIGGWDRSALTEDLEAATRLVAATGRGIRRHPDVEVWEQPVLDGSRLVRQRLRWAEGAIRRDLRVTWPAVLGDRLPPRLRLDLAAYAVQTLMPWLAFGLLIRGDRAPARRRLIALGWTYVVGGTVVAAKALGGLDRRVPGVLAVGALWPAVLPFAWLRVAFAGGPVRFAKTEHRPGFSPPERPRAGTVAPRRPPRASGRPPATTHRDGAEGARSRQPGAASDGRRPGTAVPMSRRTCP